MFGSAVFGGFLLVVFHMFDLVLVFCSGTSFFLILGFSRDYLPEDAPDIFSARLGFLGHL